MYVYIYLFSEIVNVQFVLSLHYFVSLLTATFVSILTLLNIHNYTLDLLLINLPSLEDTSIVDCLLSLLDNKSIIKHIHVTHSLLLILPFFIFFTFSSADNNFFSRYSTFTSNFSSRLFNSYLSNDKFL